MKLKVKVYQPNKGSLDISFDLEDVKYSFNINLQDIYPGGSFEQEVELSEQHKKHGCLCECDCCVYGGVTRCEEHFTLELRIGFMSWVLKQIGWKGC